MLAVLDKREGKAVQAILREIAETYPQVSMTSTTCHLIRVRLNLLTSGKCIFRFVALKFSVSFSILL